ncbi:MAG: nucleotidyltransferase [Myxococcota bacterium]
MTDFRRLLDALASERVEFVVIGGVAVIAHGYSRLTEDLDICYRRTRENMERLARALAPLEPTLRGAPRDLPFILDERTLRAGLNFTLESNAGDIDLLGEVTGVGTYETVMSDAIELDIYGHAVRVMSLDRLELSKRAAGRAKDLADLEAIREIKKRR